MASIVGTSPTSKQIMRVYSGVSSLISNNWANSKLFNSNQLLFESGVCSYTVNAATNTISNPSSVPIVLRLGLNSSITSVTQPLTQHRLMIYASQHLAGINTYAAVGAVGTTSYGTNTQTVLIQPGQSVVFNIYIDSLAATQPCTFSAIIEQLV